MYVLKSAQCVCTVHCAHNLYLVYICQSQYIFSLMKRFVSALQLSSCFPGAGYCLNIVAKKLEMRKTIKSFHLAPNLNKKTLKCKTGKKERAKEREVQNRKIDGENTHSSQSKWKWKEIKQRTCTLIVQSQPHRKKMNKII